MVSTAQRENCATTVHVTGWIAVSAAWFSTMLFLFRAWSVFYNSKPARVILGCLWFIAALGTVVIPFSVRVSPVPPDGLCAIASISKLGVVPSITVAIFDFAVYVSISYRTINVGEAASKREKFMAFFSGSNTGAISKGLLRTGQLYFLYVVCFQCVKAILN